MKQSAILLTLLIGTFLLPFASYADDPDGSVARVAYISGDVSYQRGDDDGWNSLRVNTPLVTGDSFYAPEGGRAEVDLGRGIVVRVDGGTQVNLVNNTRGIAQLGLNSGILDLSARSFPRDFTLEIDTPSAAATLLEPGRYRVNVTDRLTTYSVVQGSMSLAMNGQQLDVREGESLELENTDPPSYGYGRLSGGTPFQSWADSRDSHFVSSASARYVNADVVGYQDLDDHGTWRDNNEYGRVWVPSGMSAGWAPYQSGRWIWQDPYGWTWVSNESWGWAPYHYGRWVRAGNDWGWVPPPPSGYRGPAAVMSIDAMYAPALVAFVGGEHWGMSLSIGGPAIGWVPLAPAERYYYPWQSAPRATNNYTNITVNNAVTIVNYNTFATSAVRPIHVERAQIEQAPVIGYTAVGVVPGRGSLVVSSPGGQNAAPHPRPERPMVARLVPPPRPEQFSQKAVQIEKTGRPVASPVVITGAVGKPFVQGTPAPAGVSAVSALAPGGQKDLSPRGGAESRPPKKIERDIAPPPPTARHSGQQAAPTVAEVLPTKAPVTPAVVPHPVPPEPAPAPANGHGKPPRDVPTNNGNYNGTHAAMASPAPLPAPAPAPAPPPEPASRQGRPAPVTPAVVPHPVPPEPAPAASNGHGKPPREVPTNDRNYNGTHAAMASPAPLPAPPPEPASRQSHPAPVAPPPVRPDAAPASGNGHGRPPQATPENNQSSHAKQTPVPPPASPQAQSKPAAKAVPPPPPVQHEAAAVPGGSQPKPPEAVPKNKKTAKGKHAPEPPPEPPPQDGK